MRIHEIHHATFFLESGDRYMREPDGAVIVPYHGRVYRSVETFDTGVTFPAELECVYVGETARFMRVPWQKYSRGMAAD